MSTDRATNEEDVIRTVVRCVAVFAVMVGCLTTFSCNHERLLVVRGVEAGASPAEMACALMPTSTMKCLLAATQE